MSDVYGKYTPPTGGGMFVTIKDGENVKLRLVSEPYIFQEEFQQTEKFSTKYAWVVYNYDDKKGQIFKQGVKVYKAIAALAVDEDWGDPTNYDIRVSREGSDKQTAYHITPLKKSNLDAKILEETGKVDLKKVISNAIPLSQVLDGAAVPTQEKNDVVPTEVDDEVNLADIPF